MRRVLLIVEDETLDGRKVTSQRAMNHLVLDSIGDPGAVLKREYTIACRIVAKMLEDARAGRLLP